MPTHLHDFPMSLNVAKLKLLNLTKTIETFLNKLAWVCKIIIVEYSVVDNKAQCFCKAPDATESWGAAFRHETKPWSLISCWKTRNRRLQLVWRTPRGHILAAHVCEASRGGRLSTENNHTLSFTLLSIRKNKLETIIALFLFAVIIRDALRVCRKRWRRIQLRGTWKFSLTRARSCEQIHVENGIWKKYSEIVFLSYITTN